MIYTIDNYESINKEVKELIYQEVEPSDGRCAKTTDVDEDSKKLSDNLHTNKKFKKLFKEIEKGIHIYLKECEYKDVFNIYMTKAWATLTKKGQYIAPHKHTASHLSVVYYVEADDQGDLTINSPRKEGTGLYVPASTEYYENYNEHNVESITYGSRTGDLVIFPSNMMHLTNANQKDSTRISIGIDVLITMKKGIKSEHNMPDPQTWKKI